MKNSMLFRHYFTATTSISTKAPRGRSFTANAARAGHSPVKYFAYTFVHGGEIRNVAQQAGGLHHVRISQPCLLEDITDVLERLLGLLLDASFDEFAGVHIHGLTVR